MREAILPDVDDSTLGRVITNVAEVARRIDQNRWGVWDITDETVEAYIRSWRARDENK